MDYLDEQLPRPRRTHSRRLQPARIQGITSSVRLASRDVETWNARDLYDYLYDRAYPELRIQLRPGAQALRGTFKLWLQRDGLTPIQVRAMLDAFLTREDWHHVTGYPAWRILIFRGGKGDLQETAAKLSKQDEARANRGNKEYWSKRAPAPPKRDKDYWLGKTPRAD